MQHNIICPYCKSNKKTDGSYFKTWNSLPQHIRYCKEAESPSLFVIDPYYGSIHVDDLFSKNYSSGFIRYLYPKLSRIPSDIRRDLVKKGILLPILNQEWSSNELIKVLQDFYTKHNRVPATREMLSIVSIKVFERCFGSFNNAVKEAGFIPIIQNGFGHNTYGDDGLLYDSGLEAYFSNKLLSENLFYEVHKKYGNGWTCDFYLPEKDLYIEIDGELDKVTLGKYRERINEKIQFCKINRLNLLVLSKKDIYKKDFSITKFV